MEASYSIEVLNNPEVVLIYMGGQFGEDHEEVRTYAEELFATYEDLAHPVYVIMNTMDMKVNFDETIGILRQMTHGPTNLMLHPMVREYLIVTDIPLHRMIIKGLRGASFGNIKIQAYDSLEAALERLRAEAA